MACYHPTIIKIYQTPELDKKITKLEKIVMDDFERIYNDHIDKWEIVTYNAQDGNKIKIKAKCIDIIIVPCGNCIGCALDNALHWKTRLMCENEYHKKGYFLTFTYDNEHLPKDYQLKTEDAKMLIKKMQNYAYRNNIKDFKYYLVGEYGGTTGRPHMHAIIWGINVDQELKKISKTTSGNYIYESKTFNDFWKKGFTSIGTLEPESIGYVCRYATKKQVLTRDQKYHNKILGIQSEFMYCSKGIGDQYYIDNFDKICKNNGVFYIDGQELHTERRFKVIADKLGKTQQVIDQIIIPNKQNSFINRHHDKLINDHENLNKMYLDKEWLKKEQIKTLKRK